MKRHKSQPANGSTMSDDTADDSRYLVLGQREKERSVGTAGSDKLMSEGIESDSDESIFEVPVPPKPQPPVINLQDSDDESEESSNNNTPKKKQTNASTQYHKSKSVSPNAKALQRIKSPRSLVSQRGGTVLESAIVERTAASAESCSTVDNIRTVIGKEARLDVSGPNEINEDIVLNCTTSHSTRDVRREQNCLNDKQTPNELDDSVQNLHNVNKGKSATKQRTSTVNAQNESNVERSISNVEEEPSESRESVQNTEKNNKGKMHANKSRAADLSFNNESNAGYDHAIMHKDARLRASTLNFSNVNEDYISVEVEAYPRAKSIDFTDDSILEVQISSVNDQLKVNRKRQHDLEEERGKTKIPRQENILYREDVAGSNENIQRSEMQQQEPDELEASCSGMCDHGILDVKDIQKSMSRDPSLWVIMDEDLMPSPRKRNQRYWNAKCTHCQRDGHYRYNCTEPRRFPRCHMCGTEGHTETRCPQKMCLTCGKKQATFRKTCESCRTFYCTMCNAIGHKSTDCPDLWRRYHQTTQSLLPNFPTSLSDVMKPPDLLFCCNCTKRGHDASTCGEYRWSQHFPTPAFVSSYDTGAMYSNEVEDSTAVSASNSVSTSTHTEHSVQGTSQQSPNPQKKNVLYSYSSCTFGVNEKPIETVRLDAGNKKINTSTVQNKVHVPKFVERLPNIYKFKVEVLRQKTVTIVISTYNFSAGLLVRLMKVWIAANDKEKDSRICTDLPFERSKFIKVLESKFEKCEEVVQKEHANKLYRDIRKLTTMNMDSEKQRETVMPELLEAQEKLIIMSHMLPIKSTSLNKLNKIYRRVQTKYKAEVPLHIYLHTLYLYNEIFAPYTLPNSGRTVNILSDWQNKHSAQVSSLAKRNKKLDKQDVEKQNVSKKSDSHLQKSQATIQQKESSVLVPNTQIQCNTVNTGGPLEKISCVPITQPTQNQLSSGVVTLPQPDTSKNNTFSPSHQTPKTTDNDESTITQTTKSLNNENTDNHIQCIVIDDESEETDTNPKGDSVVCNEEKSNLKSAPVPVAKKKKNPGKQKRKSFKKLFRLAQVEINKARKLSVPYMMKAAKDVEQKLKRKDIKEKHIDVLRKLITMETMHQKQMKSFCNDLQ